MTRNLSLLSTLCLLVPLAGGSVPEAMAAGAPSLADTYAATVRIEQTSQGVLVRSVQNRLVIAGVDPAGVRWIEVRGPKSTVRSRSLTTEMPDRLITLVTLPKNFEGPASIALGFSDGSERVLSESYAVVAPLVQRGFFPVDEKGDPIPRRMPSQSFAVVDPLVKAAFIPVDEKGDPVPSRMPSESFAVVDPLAKAAFMPVDEKGDPVPPPIPITDELISRLSVLSIQCPNPSIPHLDWVDRTSVAAPPWPCSWPKEFHSMQGFTYYFYDPYTGQVIGKNCPVRLKLVAMDQSGFHCHSDPNRPVGTYNPKVGNTGPSGLDFDVAHEWPLCATLLQVIFWSTQEGCPDYNDSTTVDWYFYIVGSVDNSVGGPGLEELLPGTGYTLKEPTDEHPDAYWGLAGMNTALQAVAAAYADSLPGHTLGFNDMSLPTGGTFDLGPPYGGSWWEPPKHCGHQVGNEMDLQSKLLTADQQLVAKHFFRTHVFRPKPEGDHWHVKYYGPGTYRGPGHTLTLPPEGDFRGVAVANDARVFLADSVFTWSAATNVIPEVSGQATWNQETNSWTYTYTVKNDISSPNVIMTFGLAPVLEPQSIVAPTHWYQSYGFEGRDDAVVWSVVDAGAPPVGWDSVSTYPSPFDIQPGDSVSSFSIVSHHGPGWITYFVEGYYDLPREPDEPDAPSLFNNSVTGTVVGPVGAVGGVDEGPLPSAIVELRSPVPNPASATVSVTFYLPEPSHVVLAVYDAAGRRVRVLVDGDQPSGVHLSSWNGYDENGRRVSAGVYFCQLRVGGKAAGTQRMVIVR